MYGTYDMGTEFGLNLCKGLPIENFFPWLDKSLYQPAPAEGEYRGMQEDEFEEPDDPSSREVSLDRSLAAAGVMHIVRGVGDSVVRAELELNEALDAGVECSNAAKGFVNLS